MSAPLPSPPPLSSAQDGLTDSTGDNSGTSASAKPIPRSRPTPIATAGSPEKAGGTPASYKYRPGAATSIGKSFNNDNWRDRSPAPTSTMPATLSGKGPERTVGFEKRDVSSLKGNGGSALSREREKEENKEKESEKDKEGKEKSALSHVPCRFFKAGACTAGESCPFSHAAPDSAKREVCQWFLKGNCKFGHKCALAHVRPGEPMSMDRKNKKAAQLEARERSGEVTANGTRKATPTTIPSASEESGASPVPIRSALSSSVQSNPTRIGSSPMREPFGPPSGALPNSPPTGFAHSYTRGHPAFASSPNRPSPLSASFGAVGSGLAAGSVPGPLSLKQGANVLSTLRPPVTAAPTFSSSFSHSSLAIERPSNAVATPLSASFAGEAPPLHRSIWARSDQPAEPLSPRRPIPRTIKPEAVFEDDDDHGEEFLPSSLSDLLTPQERARRMSRRDSQDSSYSPSLAAFAAQAPAWGGERLAQSAGPTMGQKGFLQSLWSADGEDVRKFQPTQPSSAQPQKQDFAFGPATAQASGPRTSLLTQQRSPGSASPTSPIRLSSFNPPAAGPGEPFLIRNLGDPGSPSARALIEHAPGQSLPGGLANALSRLHLHGPRSTSSLVVNSGGGGRGGGGLGAEWRLAEHEAEGSEDGDGGAITPNGAGVSHSKREEHDEGLFAMDG
ncbi:hypothetical protein AYX13_01258 [Cryptococcus neoformans]|nr:hypothetical protein AYX13_01258 [Cryptococcus neoformans var. grubii]